MSRGPSPGVAHPATRARGEVPTATYLAQRARGENFPVASLVLPRATRRHLRAIYGFARLADELGDEVAGDRYALLDWLEDEVDRAYNGRPEHPAMRRLGATVAALDLPREPFLALIEANRRDQAITRYATYEDLLAYCELSANPIGRLVLMVFGAATTERVAWSDAVCTGLQLVEHWQDVGEDFRRGRVYLPAEDLARFECTEHDLAGHEPTPALRRLLAFELDRARRLLDQGEPLIASLHGRHRLAVAGFVAGGRAAASAVERSGFDVLRAAPRAGRVGFLRHLAGTLRGARP